MTTMAIQGIRGGCGSTSVTASLAWSLAQAGQSVLAIDFSRENLLRLYFDMPYDNKHGWLMTDFTRLQRLIRAFQSRIDYNLTFRMNNSKIQQSKNQCCVLYSNS